MYCPTTSFHIGEDRKRSNGDPVTAQDFVFSYKRILTSAFGAQNVGNLFVMKGAEDYFNEKITDFDQVGVKTLGNTLPTFSANECQNFFKAAGYQVLNKWKIL